MRKERGISAYFLLKVKVALDAIKRARTGQLYHGCAYLLDEICAVYVSVSSFINLSFSFLCIISYINRCVGLRGFPSVLGYVCTVEVRLEGPALQVATLVRTKVCFARSYPIFSSHFLHASLSLSSDLNVRTTSVSTYPLTFIHHFSLPHNQAQARSKKESLQLASRAVLAHLFPEATSLHQVILEEI